MIRAIYNFFQDHSTLGVFLLPLIAAVIIGGLLGFSFGGMAHALGCDAYFWGLVQYTPIALCGFAFGVSCIIWLLSKIVHVQ